MFAASKLEVSWVATWYAFLHKSHACRAR